MSAKKLIRITTAPISLKVLLRKQLKFMSDHFEVVAVSSPGIVLEEVNRNEGVRTVGVLMTRAITPLTDLRSLWTMYRLFKKEKPHIVHTHTPKAGLVGMMAARLAAVPVRVHTVAGLPLMEAGKWKKKILWFTEYLTYRCASGVYPNSSNLARFILDHKCCSPDKLKVLGNGSSNGIDADFFAANEGVLSSAREIRKELKIREDEFVYVFVGRMVRDKGIEELVDAFTELESDNRNIRLLLVGPFEPELDPLSGRTQELINANPAITHVHFKEDVRPYLAVSHALAFPSYREGFPNVPMQAGCFELPSIVTDINGCNEIIEHGKNGLIIPPKNKQALKQAMEALLTNQPLYATLKSNARSMIVQRYDQKLLWNTLLEEYKEQMNHAHLS